MATVVLRTGICRGHSGGRRGYSHGDSNAASQRHHGRGLLAGGGADSGWEKEDGRSKRL